MGFDDFSCYLFEEKSLMILLVIIPCFGYDNDDNKMGERKGQFIFSQKEWVWECRQTTRQVFDYLL